MASLGDGCCTLGVPSTKGGLGMLWPKTCVFSLERVGVDALMKRDLFSLDLSGVLGVLCRVVNDGYGCREKSSSAVC